MRQFTLDSTGTGCYFAALPCKQRSRPQRNRTKREARPGVERRAVKRRTAERRVRDGVGLPRSSCSTCLPTGVSTSTAYRSPTNRLSRRLRNVARAVFSTVSSAPSGLHTLTRTRCLSRISFFTLSAGIQSLQIGEIKKVPDFLPSDGKK